MTDYDVVSFDIFDTLIERTVSTPQKIFQITGERVLGADKAVRFRKDRVSAERKARILSATGEVTLADIYRTLEGYDDSLPELMAAEMAVETECCKGRARGIRLYESAREKEKRVILVSDMYLSKDFLTGLLLRCGISGFDALYVSCEKGCSKRTGMLYKHMLECENIAAGRVVHIGDDYKADVKMSGCNGIDSVWLVNCKSLKSKLMQKFGLVL